MKAIDDWKLAVYLGMTVILSNFFYAKTLDLKFLKNNLIWNWKLDPNLEVFQQFFGQHHHQTYNWKLINHHIFNQNIKRKTVRKRVINKTLISQESPFHLHLNLKRIGKCNFSRGNCEQNLSNNGKQKTNVDYFNLQQNWKNSFLHKPSDQTDLQLHALKQPESQRENKLQKVFPFLLIQQNKSQRNSSHSIERAESASPILDNYNTLKMAANDITPLFSESRNYISVRNGFVPVSGPFGNSEYHNPRSRRGYLSKLESQISQEYVVHNYPSQSRMETSYYKSKSGRVALGSGNFEILRGGTFSEGEDFTYPQQQISDALFERDIYHNPIMGFQGFNHFNSPLQGSLSNTFHISVSPSATSSSSNHFFPTSVALQAVS